MCQNETGGTEATGVLVGGKKFEVMDSAYFDLYSADGERVQIEGVIYSVNLTEGLAALELVGVDCEITAFVPSSALCADKRAGDDDAPALVEPETNSSTIPNIVSIQSEDVDHVLVGVYAKKVHLDKVLDTYTANDMLKYIENHTWPYRERYSYEINFFDQDAQFVGCARKLGDLDWRFDVNGKVYTRDINCDIKWVKDIIPF